MRWRSWAILAIIVGGFVAVPAVFFISLAVADRQAMTKFKESHPFALVEGKSAKDVEAAFGPPYSRMRSEDGKIEWLIIPLRTVG